MHHENAGGETLGNPNSWQKYVIKTLHSKFSVERWRGKREAIEKLNKVKHQFD